MLERDYQRKLITKLDNLFNGCLILKNDSSYMQGIPDLSVLYKNKFALLEVKKSANENIQPNQQYYINIAKENGAFASFVFPENEEEVLNGLKEYFA